MPFSPYRQYRMSDHLNRARVPVQVPAKQPRMQPVRAHSYDAVASSTTYRPVYQPTHASMAASRENAYTSSPLATTYTPDSFNLDPTYFGSCQTSDTADSANMWGQTFDINTFNEQRGPDEDFGLGLGALGPELSSFTTKSEEIDHFPYPSLCNEADGLAFDPGSPDGQSWSSLSEASVGLASDMADFSPQHDDMNSQIGLAADFDAFLRSADSTPSVPHYAFTKSTSHCRAESAPRHNYRTSPYPLGAARGRSFSTGSVALSRTQRATAYIQGMQQAPDTVHEHPSPNSTSESSHMFESSEFDWLCRSGQSSMAHSTQGTPHFQSSMQNGPIQTSPEIVNILHSNSSSKHSCEHRFTESSSPPDLFGPLSEEPSSPPPEDFDCEESMMPRAQDLRFEGDMYTPRYVRGHGNKREGWCGTCKPGRWLVLKNSAFWYDKSFSHGISAATGSAFDGPRESRRMKGNPDVWEGLCGSCGEWIALISSKKKGTTWFRHAYKCHTHQKVKDTTKRRREVTQGRSAKAPKASSIKSESREETPFSLDTALSPLDEGVEACLDGQGRVTPSSFAGVI
ncbi:MAG: hypothetical protein Q9183_000175 [Haloplaca sp. 2 TL-2023]